VIAFNIAATLNFPRNFFGNVVGPMFKRVERQDTDRVIESPRHEVSDDRFQVRPLNGGLKCRTLGPASFHNHVERLIGAIRHDRRKLRHRLNTPFNPDSSARHQNCSNRPSCVPDNPFRSEFLSHRSNSPANKPRRSELSGMPKSKSTGAMTMQPVGRDRNAATQGLPVMPTVKGAIKTPRPKRPPSTKDALRAAKARITRRSSLQKQRDALKAARSR
jgi:hypothetical protein